jgi:SAM-dependent methyltransferase
MSIEYYQKNGDEFCKNTANIDMENLHQRFVEHLKPNSLILDAGCGSGRDSKAFLAKGFNVDAFDASSVLVNKAAELTGLDVQLSTFNTFSTKNKYDGIWACASLLHLPKKDLMNTIKKLANVLVFGGYWYMSFKYGNKQREKDGRSFTDINEQRLIDLVSNLNNIDISSTWITEDNRPDRNEIWLNAILIKD